MGEVRLIKMPLYARHGIPAVWLVDIEHDVLTCYAGSTGDAYRSASTPPDLAKIELESPAGVAIDLAAVFR